MSEWAALKHWQRDCLENAWSHESPEAVALAESLGQEFVSALPATLEAMDLPTRGQLRHIRRREQYDHGWHLLLWQKWATGTLWQPEHEEYTAVCGVTLRQDHGQSQRPADAYICDRCLARLK